MTRVVDEVVMVDRVVRRPSEYAIAVVCYIVSRNCVKRRQVESYAYAVAICYVISRKCVIIRPRVERYAITVVVCYVVPRNVVKRR